MPPSLYEDVLLCVLTYCDIHTVLCASRASKLFHTLALTITSLWVILVQDLVARRLMDALSDPNYREYSAPELREAVKRVLCGPKTWNRDSPKPPNIYRYLSIASSPMAHAITLDSRVKLLPGGRYLTLAHDDGRLQCWSLQSGECVWMHSGQNAKYSVEVLDGGDAARFVLDAGPDECNPVGKIEFG
ncbi:hypothetical protein C8R46DRAFT_1287006 [Mycena filopes]|nr:hypothetical protein C8R46DRAFT_1287006 [Mycena filopes]